MGEAFSTIVELAKLGTFGVGLAIFVLGSVIAFQRAPLDGPAVELRSKFLKYGFAYAVLVVAAGLVPLFVAGAPISMRVSFSPDLETEKLSAPIIRLPDGTKAVHDATFQMQPSAGTQVVTIAMDATLEQVRNLRETGASLSQSIVKVTKQRDALLASTAAKAAQAPASGVNLAAIETLKEDSLQAYALHANILESLNTGDFVRANQLTGELQTSVNAAEPAVAIIAKQSSEPEE